MPTDEWMAAQTDGRTDREGEANSCFLQFGNVPNNCTYKTFKLQKYHEMVSQLYAYPRF